MLQSSQDIATSRDIKTLAEGTRVDVVGLVIRRQKPNTDAIFITLEDEFGHIPILVWTDIFDKYIIINILIGPKGIPEIPAKYPDKPKKITRKIPIILF